MIDDTSIPLIDITVEKEFKTMIFIPIVKFIERFKISYDYCIKLHIYGKYSN